MNRQFLRRLVVVVVIASSSVPTKVAAQDPANPADVLTRGTMGQAVEGLRQRVERDAGDDNARFALAIAQTLRGVERLAASMHRYGLRTDTWAREMPFFRIPVPPHPNPIARSRWPRLEAAAKLLFPV